jgi:AcrR family transcriptional regulator
MAESTRKRILDAAMQDFAQSGYAATSVRRIVADAQVNIASVNYHFGSKQDLFFAILDEPFTALAAERSRRLKSLSDVPAPADIVRAFVEPLRSAGPAHRSLFFVGPMLARVLHEVPELKGQVMQRYFSQTRADFLAALKRLFPQAPGDEIEATFFLMVSTLIGGIAPPNAEPGLVVPPEEQCRIVERLVRFISAGLTAQLGEFT